MTSYFIPAPLLVRGNIISRDLLMKLLLMSSIFTIIQRFLSEGWLYSRKENLSRFDEGHVSWKIRMLQTMISCAVLLIRAYPMIQDYLNKSLPLEEPIQKPIPVESAVGRERIVQTIKYIILFVIIFVIINRIFNSLVSYFFRTRPVPRNLDPDPFQPQALPEVSPDDQPDPQPTENGDHSGLNNLPP